LKSILLLFVFITSLLSFEAQAKEGTFNIKILNKINMLNEEEENSSDISAKKRLRLKKIELINYFFEKLDNGDYASINQNSREELYSKNLDRLKKARVEDDRVGILTIKMQLNIILMEKSFKTLLISIKEYDNSLKPIDDYRALFIKYSEAMIFSNKLYKRSYDKIIKNNEQSLKEEVFLKTYDNFQDKKYIYQEIFFLLSDRTISKLKANSVITELGLDKIIGYFNSHEYFKEMDILSREYFKLSIGQILVTFIFLAIVILFKKIVIDILLFSFSKFFYKNRQNSNNKKLNNYLDLSMRLPLRYILYVIAIDISQRILFMSIDNEEVVSYFTLIYILIFVWAAFRLINNFILIYSDDVLVNYPNIRGEMINFFVNSFKAFVLIIGLLIIFSNLGYDISGIIASLGIGGLAVAFAARETIANIFGSISLILDNSFTQGDWIVVDSEEGTVVDIGMRSTKIRTFDNSMIYIPNSIVASAKIKNWSRRVIGRRIYMKLGTTYSANTQDLKNAVNEIREMLVNHPQIADIHFNEDEKDLSLKKTKVVSANHEYGIIKTLHVYLDELSESSINIMVYCFSKSVVWSEWLEVKEDVIYKIMVIFEKNNLSFAYPSQSIYIEENSLDLITPNTIQKIKE